MDAHLPDLRGRPRHLLRVAVQTVAAVSLTWLVMSRGESPNLSWAVIAALLTIDASADASFRNAVGRMIGVAIGLGLGLGSAQLGGNSVLPGLLVATVLANMIATLRPELVYAAILAALVSAESHPDAGSTFDQAGAILLGTAIGAASSFLVWPLFGRKRSRLALLRTVDDCARLLSLIAEEGHHPDAERRSGLHVRVLGHLEAARARISETRIAPRLPGGADLRGVASAVESLWHALIILDRVTRRDGGNLGEATRTSLRAVLDRMSEEAGTYLDEVRRAMGSAKPHGLDSRTLIDCLTTAQQETERLTERATGAEARALHTLDFALGEIREALLLLGRTVERAAVSQTEQEAHLVR